MAKEYILLNHDTGEFDIGYDKAYILAVLDGHLKDGTDIEDMSLYFGDKKEIIEKEVISHEYQIKD